MNSTKPSINPDELRLICLQTWVNGISTQQRELSRQELQRYLWKLESFILNALSGEPPWHKIEK